MQINALPKDIIPEIFKFLTPTGVGQLSSVNKTFYKLTKDETVWKLFCQRDQLVEYHQEHENWKETYLINSGLFLRTKYTFTKIDNAHRITAIFFNNNYLYAGDIAGDIHIYTLPGLSKTASFKCSFIKINSLFVSPDSKFLNITTQDTLFFGAFTQYDLSNLNFPQRTVYEEYPKPFKIIAFDEQNKNFFFTGKILHPTNKGTTSCSATWITFASFSQICFYKKDCYIGSSKGTINYHPDRQPNAEISRQIFPSSTAITALAGQGKCLFSSALTMKQVKILNRFTLDELLNFSTVEGNPTAIQVNGKRVATIEDGKIIMYDFSTPSASLK